MNTNYEKKVRRKDVLGWLSLPPRNDEGLGKQAERGRVLIRERE